MINHQMKSPIKIGEKTYKYKKDALAHYKSILNSYKFGQSLNNEHYDNLIALLDYDYAIDNKEIKKLEKLVETEIQDNEIQEDLIIEDIRIAKVQYNTKCFELVYDDLSSQLISYIMIINRPAYDVGNLFNTACRNAIQDDMRAVKQRYFDENSTKGFVKCQETNELSKWEDLAVDHRQPNTFSIIVDRFKEVNKIDLDEIEYLVNDNNLLLFKNENLIVEFREYHKEKANLRIVRKECNLSRTGMAKLTRNNKDLSIK